MTKSVLPQVVLSRPVRRASLLAFALATCLHTVVAGQQAGTNVNMVKGASVLGGDPFLQRQTEPTVAISTRNPCHLFAGAIDYRTVDVEQVSVDTNPTQQSVGDAWLGVYKSFNCGQTWESSLHPGYLQDLTPEAVVSPLKGYQAANVASYSLGTKSFLGDYIDVAALTSLPNWPTRSTQEWITNTGTTVIGRGDNSAKSSAAPLSGFFSPPVTYNVWTELRDVIPPSDGDWTAYSPPLIANLVPSRGEASAPLSKEAL